MSDPEFDGKIIEELAVALKIVPTETIFNDIENMNKRLSIIDEEVRFIHDIIDTCRKEINERLARGLDG